MHSQTAARRTFIKKRSSPLTFGFTAIADFTSFIGQEYLAGIMKAADDYGVNFINMTSAIRPSLFVDTSFFGQYLAKIPFMRSPLLDGLITWASSLTPYMKKEEIQSLFADMSPLPLVDIGYIDIPGAPSIRIDNDYSIHLLVEHLVKTHGFSRIAFFGSKFSLPHQLRLNSYKKAMNDFGLPVDESMIFLADSLDEQDVSAQAKLLLESFSKSENSYGLANSSLPQAILTSSDIIAHHLIEEFEKNGIRVPDDIAVTGFNNQLAGLTSSSPITTIDLAYFKRGYEAVELLIDMIMNKDTRITIHTVPTTLVIRQSCSCFEDAIIDAQTDKPAYFTPPHLVKNIVKKKEISSYLEKSLESAFPLLSENERFTLLQAASKDIYDSEANYASSILTWFRRQISKRHYDSPLNRGGINSSLTKDISALRRILLPLVSDKPELSRKIENIFHALRSLHAVHDRYEMISEQVDSYKTTNLMSLALALSSTENIRQLENAIRIKIGSLSVPGIILCLAGEMTDELSETSIEMIFPENQAGLSSLLPLKVREPSLFPKKFFPKNSPFSVTLTVLYHSGKYLGYAYIFMNTGNLALYDDLQELLAQNIYRIYQKEQKTGSRTLLLTDREKLTQNVPISPEESPLVHGGKLNAQAIVDYLLDHIDEMCDLDKMASHFGMSKSYLTRRTKELTGYSTQTLHERLKIEQAKNLIKSGKMKMNDIASRLGFSNPNYFSNVFKKVTGLRPTEFLERL